MGSFGSMDIARSGAGFSRTWIEAVSHNIANVNTINPAGQEPFRAQVVVAAAKDDGQGVEVARIVEAAGEAPTAYDPTHPLADEDGYVTRPLVDIGGQMVDLMAAQRSYQANLSVVRSAREAYEEAMRIGR